MHGSASMRDSTWSSNRGSAVETANSLMYFAEHGYALLDDEHRVLTTNECEMLFNHAHRITVRMPGPVAGSILMGVVGRVITNCHVSINRNGNVQAILTLIDRMIGFFEEGPAGGADVMIDRIALLVKRTVLLNEDVEEFVVRCNRLAHVRFFSTNYVAEKLYREWLASLSVTLESMVEHFLRSHMRACSSREGILGEINRIFAFPDYAVLGQDPTIEDESQAICKAFLSLGKE